MRLRKLSSRRANKTPGENQPGAPRSPLTASNASSSPFDEPKGEGRSMRFKHVLLNDRRGDGGGGLGDGGHEGRTPSGNGSRSRQLQGGSRQQRQANSTDGAFNKRPNTVTAAKPDKAAVVQSQRNAKELLVALSKQHRQVLERSRSTVEAVH